MSAEAGARGVLPAAAGLLPRVPWLVAVWVALLALLGSVTALLGLHRPVVVAPAAAALLLLSALLAVRLPLRRLPGDAPATAVLLVGLLAWLGWNAGLVSELLVVGRDASVFTLSAFWLRDNPTSVIDLAGGFGNSEGFSRGPGGTVFSQNTHAVPALAAAVAWVAGTDGLLAANLLVGVAAACALFVVARLVSGPWSALVVAAALCLGLPFLAFSRAPYTEPLTLLVTWLGVGLVLLALQRRLGPRWWWLAGFFLGAAGAVRVDGLVAAVGVLPVLAVHLARRPRPRPLPPVATVLRVVGGASGPVLLGYLDLAVTSPGYLQTLRQQVTLMSSVVLLATGLAVAIALLSTVRVAPAVLDRGLVLARWPLTVLVGLLAALAVVSPLVRVGRWVEPGPYAVSVSSLQGRLGLPVDGSRSYDEYMWWWVAWYQGWAVVALAAVAVVVLTWRWSGTGDPVFVVVAALLPSLLLYSVRVSITPDQVWAARRLLPVILPGMLVLAAWQLGRLPGRSRLLGHSRLAGAPPGPVPAAAGTTEATRATWAGPATWVAVAGAVLVAPLTQLHPLGGVVEDGGTRAAVDELCELTGDEAVVVVGARAVAGTLRAVCGNRVGVLQDAGAEGTDVLGAMHRMGAGSALVVSAQGAVVPWALPEPPPPQVDAVRTVWSRSLLGAPRTSEEVPVQLWVGEVQDDGRVLPVVP